jgi:hypothetical protein
VPDKLLEYRLRIRNAADSADALEVTSVRGGTNPYISGEPTGDGASFDPLTGVVTSGVMTVRVVDPITSGTSRLVSSQLEDANGRQQLGRRRAYLELRQDGGAWQSLYAGRLGRYGLVSDIEWEIAVTDWMNFEREFILFEKESDDELISNFLSRWPNRSCIFGGPVIGGLTGIQTDLGGWTMKVFDSSGGGTTRYRLEPVSIYGPGAWLPGSGQVVPLSIPINEVVREIGRAAPKISPLTTLTTVGECFEPGPGWLGLIALIQTTPGGSWVPWRVMDAFNGNLKRDEVAINSLIYAGDRGGPPGVAVLREGQTALTIGATVQVRCLTILPSDLCPIWFRGHPADFLATAWAEAGFPYSASSITTVKDTLGRSLEIIVRLAGPEKVGPLLERVVYGPFGIGARVNSNGELEAFCSRIFSNVVPSVTITETDVEEGSTEAFDLDPAEAVHRVTFQLRDFYRDIGGTSIDGILEREHVFERENADPGAIGGEEHEYAAECMVRFLDVTEMDALQWVNARALEVFDRRGRGPIRARTTILRSSSAMSAKIGDEILVDLPQMPKGNKRLLDDAAVSARPMQIVHLTPKPVGNEVELEDSGPNASPLGTVPTHTVALSSDIPRRVAQVTITNAAAINAAGYALRLQMAVTTGGAPALTDYADVAVYDEGDVPTTAIRLPAATTGRTVYVRARTEDKLSRPSAWSAGVSIALTSIAAPTIINLAAVAADGSTLDLDWTIGAGATDCETDIWLRRTADPAGSVIRVRTLPPGSTHYRFEGLSTGTAYTVGVQHRDPTSGDTSSRTDLGQTTSATARTLNPPLYPVGFSGVQYVE